MTFSIVAQCRDTGQFGVAAATAMPAVGKLLTHARAGVGAVATQARLNPYLGIDGLHLLADGHTAHQARDQLRAADPRADVRQFALVDRDGRTAAWTGSDCPHWAGVLERDAYSVQGNRLAGRAVLEEAAEMMDRNAGRPLSERFLAALEAGDAAGGDIKGELSATIYIVATEEYPLWDIRVDHHPTPIAELRRLHDVFCERLLPEIKRMPTRANPAGDPGEHAA